MENQKETPESQVLEMVPIDEETVQTKQETKQEQSDGIVSSTEPSASQQKNEYVTGIKLALIVGAVSFICFLMLLDTSIVVTVS